MIIAVSGYRGSGKSLFGKVAKKMGFEVFEMSKPILDLMQELGMEITNESVRNFATEFRQKGGAAAVAKMLLPKIRPALNRQKSVVVIGARSLDEIEEFRRAAHTIPVAIISPEESRFERIRKRGEKSDPQKIQDFRWADSVEEKWGLKKLIEAAEVKIRNDSGEKIFREKVQEFLEKYK